MARKTCNSCLVEKSLFDFGVDRSKSDGVRATCKDCWQIRARQKYRDNPEPFWRRQQRYYKKRDAIEVLSAAERAAVDALLRERASKARAADPRVDRGGGD